MVDSFPILGIFQGLFFSGSERGRERSPKRGGLDNGESFELSRPSHLYRGAEEKIEFHGPGEPLPLSAFCLVNQSPG